MRRGFNKSILPKVPPKKHRHVSAKKKTEHKKSALMKDLFCDYREQAGDQYNRDDFAKALDVLPSTVRRYFSGYFPHQHNFWRIARYFAPLIGCSVRVVYEDIKKTRAEAEERL